MFVVTDAEGKTIWYQDLPLDMETHDGVDIGVHKYASVYTGSCVFIGHDVGESIGSGNQLDFLTLPLTIETR